MSMALHSSDHVRQFIEAMRAAGCPPASGTIMADGTLHRADVAGRPKGKKHLAYRFHTDGIPAGYFKDWKTGAEGTWCAKSDQKMTPEELAAFRRKIEADRLADAAEQAANRAEGKARAQETYDGCQPADTTNAYLARKGVIAAEGLRQDRDGRLIVPLQNAAGAFVGIQSIAPDGRKLFNKHCAKAGAFFPIGDLEQGPIVIAEGYATSASVHMATGWATIVAFDAGNLRPVAKAIRARFRGREIVIAADDDHDTEGNPGLTQARAAASDVGGRVASPPPGLPGTDFNDLHATAGIAAVKDALQPAGERVVIPFRRPEGEPPEWLDDIPMTEPDDFEHGAGGGSSGPVDDTPRPARYADDALALDFADAFGNDLRFVDTWGRWYIWKGHLWRVDDTLEAWGLARPVCRAAAQRALVEERPETSKKLAHALCSAKTIAAVERIARSDVRLRATVDQWDADLWILNTPDGIVDLKTGEMRPPDRSAHCTKSTAVAPAPDGTVPTLWNAFLHRVTAGDTGLMGFLQRLAGYCLTGVTSAHALAFAYGTGANGKSVFVNTLSGLMGGYATSTPIETFMATGSDRHPTELADLRGARLVTASETEEGRRWAESRIKQMTGGDPIKARYMRQDFFEYMPQFKLLLSGNHKPGLRGVDEAIRRRLHLIPFTVTIPPQERDPDLPRKLREEWPAILRWMIDGCLVWQEMGLAPPDAVLAATAGYLAEEDAFELWAEECCARMPDAWESGADLFASWKAWAERAQEFVGSQKRFSQTLEARGVRPHRHGSGTRGFNGLRVIRVATSYHEGDER